MIAAVAGADSGLGGIGGGRGGRGEQGRGGEEGGDTGHDVLLILRFGLKPIYPIQLQIATVILSRNRALSAIGEVDALIAPGGHGEPDIEAFRAAALRCPLPSAVELIGEKWAFLILRGALNGLAAFRAVPGGPGDCPQHPVRPAGQDGRRRNPRARADPADRRKVVYSLTAKGEGLLPVVLALRQWGEDWGHGCQDIIPRRPARRPAGPADLRPGPDGRELKLDDLMWVDRASWREPQAPGRPLKRKGRPDGPPFGTQSA